jgi:hypothetical protein
MRGHYRFLHVHDAVMGIAHVGVTAEPADDWSVRFGPDLDPYALRDFGAAMEDGVRAAIATVRERGGAPHALLIDELVWTAADTTAEVAGCAAAIAA